MNTLRIWRVVPTCKTGEQAPYFFVETTEENREKAEKSARSQANVKSRLSGFSNWEMVLTKTALRKRKSGKYSKFHQ